VVGSLIAVYLKPQFGHTRDLTAISEVGSLHSMRSHLSPTSPLSSGSAPVSLRHHLSGSNSSRPSAYSHDRTASSGRSLAHSGSISSDDRRRTRGGVSPSLSAFGSDIPSTSQFPSPPPPYVPRSLQVGPRESTVTTRTSVPESMDTQATLTKGGQVADQTTGDSELLSMPWATGLD
jgi:hypothetical protein